MEVKVLEAMPQGLKVQAEVAGCYLAIDGQILFLQSGPGKSEAGAWGLPGGKLDPGEDALQAARRELKEETGIEVDPDLIHELGCLYVQKPGFVFAFYLFQVILIEKPKVRLSPEHTAYHWVGIDELADLNIMVGGREVLAKIARWV